ncbi:MAG: Methyltransferase type 12 [Actinomycetia bacterium]|nr:Methyltransferase type 12 [Actinomycetes bacterium]
MRDVTDGHWVRWHEAYEDPGSALSQRLAVVNARLREAIDSAPPGDVRVTSMCAGQGRDVIDVLADHPGRAEVTAHLVELDAQLVVDARQSAAAAGLDGITVSRGDAALTSAYAPAVPADVVLVCGVFGNITGDDVARTVEELPHLCAEGATVLWTRHRRSPDLTPSIREWFEAAGFAELSFDSPAGTFAVGVHRLEVLGRPFRPGRRMFTFVGDGVLPPN